MVLFLLAMGICQGGPDKVTKPWLWLSLLANKALPLPPLPRVRVCVHACV